MNLIWMQKSVLMGSKYLRILVWFISPNVRTVDLLPQYPNDTNEEDKVHLLLVTNNKIAGVFISKSFVSWFSTNYWNHWGGLKARGSKAQCLCVSGKAGTGLLAKVQNKTTSLRRKWGRQLEVEVDEMDCVKKMFFLTSKNKH